MELIDYYNQRVNNINNRIKHLRKHLKLQQAEFGERIGLGGGAIGKMERGGTVTDQNIKLICEKFRVNRDWLVHGNGEIFFAGESGLFAEFAQEYHLTLPEQQIAKYLLRLKPEERDQIMKHLTKIVMAMQEGRKMEREERQRQQEEKAATDFAENGELFPK